MKKYLLLFILGLGLILGSCTKFLEESPTGSLTDQTNISSFSAGVALSTGAYSALPGWMSGGEAWGSNTVEAMEYATGKGFSQNSMSDLPKYETDKESGDRLYFINPWDNWYNGVLNCNLAIKLIPGVAGLPAGDKARLLGEVRTLRAFYYFCLVRYYGDVVANTAVLTDITLATRPRVSLKTIYDNIIVPDLEYAVNESGLVDEKSSGRVTKYVARAIMADVYLTMAGYPYQEIDATSDTTKCLTGAWTMTEYPVNNTSAIAFLQKAKTQIDFLYGKYPLGNFSDLNNPSMNNAGGAIFQIQFLAGTRDNPIVPLCLPLASLTSRYSGEFGSMIPTPEYLASYDPTDIRIKDRVYLYYSDTKSANYDPNEGPAGKFPMAFLYKYYDFNAIKVSGRSGLNFNLYRYADLLLMQTEVNWCLRTLGQGGISDDDITKGINEIRTRAGVSVYAAADVNLAKIMSERAYELIFENKMLFDMRRTRKALIDGVNQFAGIENFVGHQPTYFNYQFDTKHLLSPVSSTELDNNPKAMQNYGWAPKQKGQN
jgi:starch-binding outer membrane protein, SusD/RagB family